MSVATKSSENGKPGSAPYSVDELLRLVTGLAELIDSKKLDAIGVEGVVIVRKSAHSFAPPVATPSYQEDLQDDYEPYP